MLSATLLSAHAARLVWRTRRDDSPYNMQKGIGGIRCVGCDEDVRFEGSLITMCIVGDGDITSFTRLYGLRRPLTLHIRRLAAHTRNSQRRIPGVLNFKHIRNRPTPWYSTEVVVRVIVHKSDVRLGNGISCMFLGV